MRKSKSILFVRPDYHCSFIYRDEFRSRGWKVGIYVQDDYPNKLLYSKDDILTAPIVKASGRRIFTFINKVSLMIWWLGQFWRYKYHIYYGRPPAVSFFEEKIGLTKLFGNEFLIELWLAKKFGTKLIFLPTGCHDEDNKAEYQKFDAGNVCANCGFWDRCNDQINDLNFSRIRKFFDMQTRSGLLRPTDGVQGQLFDPH